ncbi:hypothetical protein [Nitrososphaera sp.]
MSEYKCHACGAAFESLGDMQKHVLIDHLQSEGLAYVAKKQANAA